MFLIAVFEFSENFANGYLATTSSNKLFASINLPSLIINPPNKNEQFND